ncbi:protein FAR-RED IMPAIRED RESPONSE 1-like [Henckelia pumila]|uniref:protein FAR-RED IMPAIRED RESPONSE 1-like n=1 Tax=Henckelia pumila TaxID=405737 RepID=UPI003C6DEC7F
MVDGSQRYLLRSARKVSYAQGETLRAMSEAGIKHFSVLSYIEIDSHGVKNLGFIRKDSNNYLNCVTKGHSRVENGDAFELMQSFKTKSNDEDLFYWDIQMDENGCFSNFFYRDGRARVDYEYFGSLNVNPAFKGMFTKCMQFCDSEEEFNIVWAKMIDEFGLHDHSWLKGMHKYRHKWSTTFSTDKFCARLKATSRSESTNFVLKDGGNKTFTLFEFVKKFETIQKRWRTNKNEEDYRCRHTMPSIVVKNQPLLQHAASVYTIEIYKIFENELVNSLNIEFDSLPSLSGSVEV